MKIYTVGGYVRDLLLKRQGYPISTKGDRDWVVVGSTPDEMRKLGFTPVGKDFPVFLHPKTHEEYALARTERKIATGYHGFEFHTSPSVTLQEDLSRRDLTINAIAMDETGAIYDPFHGVKDLKSKILRHVSLAFVEDPVRILRIARFSAKLPEFTIAPETQTLLKTMVTNGEADSLVVERVWQELWKGFSEKAPIRMVDVLMQCGLWAKLFPELPPLTEQQITNLGITNTPFTALERLAILLEHNVDEPTLSQILNHLRAPRVVQEFCHLFWYVAHTPIHAYQATELAMFFQRADGLRKPERLLTLLTLCAKVFPTTDWLSIQNAFEVWRKTDISNVVTRCQDTRRLPALIFQQRLDAIQKFLDSVR